MPDLIPILSLQLSHMQSELIREAVNRHLKQIYICSKPVMECTVNCTYYN